MSLVLLVRAKDQKESLSKTCSSLFSLILELGVESVISHVALMDRQLSCHSNKVTYALIQIAELRDLSFIKNKFLQIV